MSWELLSLVAALGQAISWTLKKKTLENLGIDKTVGAVAYLTAGITLSLIWLLSDNIRTPVITEDFARAAVITISLNILAAWAGFKALNYGKFTMLMPFIAITALGIVPLEYFLRGILPAPLQFIGVLLIVTGAIVFSIGAKLDKVSRKAAMLFGITIVCYTFTATYMGIMQEASGDTVFSAAVMHIGIAAGFVFLLFFHRESAAIATLKKSNRWKQVLSLMIVTGLIIGLLENWPTFEALQTASANEVFSLKRTMPIFALIIGVMFFHEKTLWRHKVGTVLMVSGAMIVIYFKP